MQLHFLYGTETGTAEFLCEDLQAAIGEEHTSAISSLDTVKPSDLNAETFYILVSSTYGSGDVPTTAIDFHEALINDRPNLENISFAMFGLGDETFGETYNQGSERLMAEMLACKAQMVGERGMFNAASSEMPEEVAIPWLEGVLALQAEKQAA
ncbi:MAG: flavodoxin domain-containing protein [Pseudomonadota bacterium]